MKLEQRPGRNGRGAAFDELVVRIDRETPDLDERVPGIPFLHDDANRLVDERKPERLGKRPIHLLRFGRRLPLAVDRGEASREERLPGGGVGHFEEVLAAIRVVERLCRITGPGQWLDDDAIQAELFLGRVSGVIVVDSHRRRLDCHAVSCE